MTGYDVMKRATSLLGYSGGEGDPAESDSAALKGLEIIKQLSMDLRFGEISSLSESLDIPQSKTEALCYGMAMLLALTEGDANKNRLFAEIYNAKRGAALAETANIKDCLPTSTVG